MLRIFAAVLLAAGMVLPSPIAAAPPPPAGITILSASFGTLGARRKLDLVEPLTRLCGGGTRCEVFCSETSFGRWRLGSRPICRVAYRCPDGSTRSAEAAKEEPILLRCPEDLAPEPPAPPVN